MDATIGEQHGVDDPPPLPTCLSCDRPRPHARWAPGLEAVLPGEGVAWLCAECAALPGQAWAFVDAVRALVPEADLRVTAAYAGRLVRAPLVVPGPEHGAPPAPARSRRRGTDRLLPTKPPD